MKNTILGRRSFLRDTFKTTIGASSLSMLPFATFAAPALPDDNLHIIGPKQGYTPQIGTLVSMMNWMRETMLLSVIGMQQAELDFLFDEKANTIGAMLLHLAATESFYQANTFEGRTDYNGAEKKKWEAAMTLGDIGRRTIKGNDLDYYLNILKETREKTLTEFRKRDDKWLTKIDAHFFDDKPTNNYCKWFHVCEHESNHNGQIKWLKSRLPGGGKGE